MSISIEWLANLPQSEQEKVLQSLANTEELKPIEVDGTVYHVPVPVLGLIDSLWLQLQEKDNISAVEKD